jgi:hypothetical protein
MDDVVTTAPSIPVLAHRPAIENVKCPPFKRTAASTPASSFSIPYERACRPAVRRHLN